MQWDWFRRMEDLKTLGTKDVSSFLTVRNQCPDNDCAENDKENAHKETSRKRETV
jgi:hypothetical protein